MIGVELGAAGADSRSSTRRIAGSSRLSTGLPSSTQLSSASRNAGTPGLPRRAWRSTALRKRRRGGQPSRHDVANRRIDRLGIERPEVAERAQDVRRANPGPQHGRQVLEVARPVNLRPGDLRLPGSAREGARRPGRGPDRGMPQRNAAERCDAMASRPAAMTAAQMRCAIVRSEPIIRATPGWTGSMSPNSSARYHGGQGCGRARRLGGSPSRGARGRTRREVEGPCSPECIEHRKWERRPNPGGYLADCRRGSRPEASLARNPPRCSGVTPR